MLTSIDNQPGVRWSAEWRGPAPEIRGKALSILAWTGVICAIAPFTWWVVSELPSLTTSGWNMELVVILLIVWGPTGFLPLYYAYLKARVHWPYCSSIAIDASSKTVSARVSGLFFWFGHERIIPFEALRRVRFDMEIGEDRKPARIVLRLEGDGWKLGLPLLLEGADDLGAPLEALFRFGRVLGWRQCVVRRNDRWMADLDLMSAPVPGSVALAEKEGDPFTLPAVQPEPLVLEGFGSKFRVRAWEPGKRIHVVEEPPPWPLLLKGTVAMWLVITYVVFFSELPKQDPYFWDFEVLIDLVGLVFYSWLFFKYLSGSRYESLLDWGSGTATLAVDGKAEERPLSSIQIIRIEGLGRLHWLWPDSSRFFSCRIVLEPAHTVFAATDDCREDPQRAYRRAVSLAAELAKSLGVSWSGPEVPESFARSVFI